jgi:hypothetical protein
VVKRHPVLLRHKYKLTLEIEIENVRVPRLRVIHHISKGQLQVALGRVQKLKVVDVRKLLVLVIF